MNHRALRVLGLRLDVTADDPGLIQPFLDVFDAFLLEPPGEATGGVDIRIEDGTYDDGVRRVALAADRLRPSHVYNLLYTTFIRRLANVYLLHCAVVADEERAFLIGGPSGSGKSTLARKLVERGFGLLSDDLAPLAVPDGTIQPFPRRLGFVRKSMSEAGLSEDGARLLGDKAFLPPERLGARVVDRPLAPGAIVLMNPYREPEGWVEMTIGLLADPDPLLDRLQAHDGVEAECRRRLGDLSIVSLKVRGGAEAITAVEEELERVDQEVMFHYRGYGSDKRYAEAPRLEPLSSRDATFALLRETLNRERTGALMRRLDGSAAAFFELSGLLAGVPSFRLAPADADATADLLARTFRSLPSASR